MASTPRGGILTALAFGAAALGAAPATGFEIFGIHLWGPREPEEGFEVIDPLPYTVTLRVAGGENGLERRLQGASALWSDRETPASGTGGLLSKARGDYRRLLAALYAEGYYGPTISIRAAGIEVAEATLAVQFPPQVPVTIDVTAGPQFLFGATQIVNAPPARVHEDDETETPASVGFLTGETARSGVINQASALSIERWRQLSHAKAREADREVIADHGTDRLDVRLALEPGRQARYGPVTVAGSSRMHPGFVAWMADLPEGHPFDSDDIEAAQDRLSRLGVFRSLRFEEGEIEPDGSMPITIRVEDRRPRSIGAGATYSTIDGFGVNAFWEHRNLFGRAERLRYFASVDGVGSINLDDYSYELGVAFTRPGVLTPDTNFVAGASAFRLDYETYRQRGVKTNVGFTQQFNRRLTGQLMLQASRSRYEDDLGSRDFTIVSVLGGAAYDRRNDPFDATRGYYVAATVEPFHEFEFGNTGVRGTLEGRGYLSFGAEDRVTLAGRALVGSFAGAPIEESPPDLLFFAGGGGSVRGYAYQSIGVETFDVEDDDDIVVGGRGLFETSTELRYRLTDRWGGVGFVDTGLVTEDGTLSGESDFRVGAGAGVRFYTTIGVLRADVATPVTPRDDDGYVALYIGIGQAF